MHRQETQRETDERTDAEYVWVLDPIDGTKSFISGMPAWGTLIALLRSAPSSATRERVGPVAVAAGR